MKKENPYEYHNEILGVQGRFLVSGRDAHPDSLCLISDSGLRQRILRGATIRIRPQAPNTPMLVSFDSLPYKWQEAIVRVWGNAPKLIQQTLFEKHFVRDYAAFDFFCYHRFEDQSTIERHRIDEYTLNASVLRWVLKFDFSGFAEQKNPILAQCVPMIVKISEYIARFRYISFFL